MQKTRTIKLIGRISSILKAEERKKYAVLGLQPTHGEILEYLASCNSFSDTLIGVTEYFGLTKGTVSQSIQVLQRKGYIEKQTDKDDRRITHLRLSSLGESILNPYDYYNPEPVTELNSEDEALADALEKVLATLQRDKKFKTFGVCHSCVYFKREEGHYHCEGSGHDVYSSEVNKICKEHIPIKLITPERE